MGYVIEQERKHTLDPNYVNYVILSCIDCGKKLQSNSKRCRSCAQKKRRIDEPVASRPGYKDGRCMSITRCVDCEKVLSRYTYKRCTSCQRIRHSIITSGENHRDVSGENNGMFGQKRKRIYNASLDKEKFVKIDEVDNYILSGWVLGQSESHIRNTLRSVCKRPNKFETNALVYLNALYNGLFRYTGDGSFIVNSRSSDAYSKELNTVALFQGDYFHCNPRHYQPNYYNSKRKMHASDIWKYDDETVDIFKKAGYLVIVIWEHEVNTVAKV